MKLFIRYSVLLFAFCMLTGHVYAGDVLFDFLNSFNGLFTNQELINNVAPGQPTPVSVKLNFVPIKLLPRWVPVLYFQYIVNEQTVRREVWHVTSDLNNVATVMIYNLTTADNSEDFDRFDVLAALKLQDFYNDKKCVGIFLRLSNGWFTGGKPDCLNNEDKKYAIFSGTSTCNSIMFNYPPIAIETTPFIPVVVKREGERYPVPGTPPNYSNPCDDSNS